ncbi:MAG: PKD domain-containing protein, partial [Bacteroidia bacterium]
LRSGASGSRIVFNSVNITGTDVENGVALEVLGGNNYVVKNNIFANNGGGYAANISQNPSLKDWDFNSYFSSGPQFGLLNNTPYNQLADWGPALGGDANSKKLPPLYESTTELLPAQRQLNGSGVASQNIILDIDGEIRNQLAPDIGAQEFMVDFGITDLVNPSLDCYQTASENVTIALRQFGDIPFINLRLAYQLNNGQIYYDTIPGAITNDIHFTFNNTVDLSQEGTYLFKLWLIDNSDDNPNNDTLFVTRFRKPSPVVDFNFAPQCAKTAVPFTGLASISQGFIADYVWNFGDGTEGVGQNTNHIFDIAGTYDVNLKAFSNEGCFSEITKPVSLFASPEADFEVSDICSGGNVSITNQTQLFGGTGNLSYAWNFGDGTTGTGLSPAHVYANAGNYQILLTASNSNGCTDTTSRLLTVNQSPVITFNLSGTYPANTAPIVLAASPVGGEFSGIGVIGNTFYPILAGVGTFTITYTYENSVTGCSGSQSRTITIIPAQFPPVIISQPSSFAICEGRSELLFVGAQGQDLNFQWYKNNVAILGANSTSYNIVDADASVAGTYFVEIWNELDTIQSTAAQITFNGSSSAEQTVYFCTTAGFTLPNGEFINEPGTYTRTIPSILSCDSVVTTIAIAAPVIQVALQQTICNSQSYLFNGEELTIAGIYTDTLTSIGGCDSIVTLNLVVNEITFGVDNIVSCIPITWIDGNTYSNSTNSPTFTYSNSAGCDSVVTLNLTITPQPEQPATACYETATFNTATCSWDVTGTQPEQPATACYETATFNAATCSWDVSGIQPEQPATTCYETATFNAATCSWDVTGTQPEQPTTACYETATFNTATCSWDVTGTPAPAIVTNAAACGSYTWSANGETYSTSGQYSFNSNCQDYTLNLSINQASASSITATITQGETYSFDGQNLTTAGTYTATLQNTAGCDSVVTLTLTVNPAPPAGCFASSVVDFIQGYNSSGGPVETIRSNSAQAIGLPEPVVDGVVNFVSLGFGGSITLSFAGPIANGPGADIRIDEATWGASNTCNRYPETADVFASQDGINFVYLGRGCQDMSLDLGLLSWAQYVRIVDVSNIVAFSTGADGFDVNGVECLNGSATSTPDDGLVACSLQEIVSYTAGLRKNGTPVPVSRSNANNALGIAQNNNTINFVSLGFGGTLVAKFDYVVFNQPGNDLRITETSFGNPSCTNYPEKARISLSLDNISWVEIGELCTDGEIDMGAMPYAQFIKIQDASPLSSNRFGGSADGYDVDAVVQLNSGCAASASRTSDEDNINVSDESILVEAFPNPMGSETTVRFTHVDVASNASIELFDATGRLVTKYNLHVDQDDYSFVFSTENLAKGLYHLVVTTGSDIYNERLVK